MHPCAVEESQPHRGGGALYPLLTRLKNTELLTYRWEESKSGPPRKYYNLTPAGEAILSELDTAWKEQVKAVKQTTREICP